MFLLYETVLREFQSESRIESAKEIPESIKVKKT